MHLFLCEWVYNMRPIAQLGIFYSVCLHIAPLEDYVLFFKAAMDALLSQPPMNER